MRFNNKTIITGVMVCAGLGCNKNYVPKNSNIPVIVVNSSNTKTAVKKKPVAANTTTTPLKIKSAGAKAVRTAVPKVILVNDNVAKKNFDGRLYYDLEGRRYWKNYVDGKYYLFDKSMYKNKAFRPG